jgi:hypothetical protein
MPILEIYRAKVDPADVEHLLEIRAAAVAEFQERLPELLQADSCTCTTTCGSTCWCGAQRSTKTGYPERRHPRRRASRCTA